MRRLDSEQKGGTEGQATAVRTVAPGRSQLDVSRLEGRAP